MLELGSKFSSLIVFRKDMYIAMDPSFSYNNCEEKKGFVPHAGFTTPQTFKGRHVADMNGGPYSYFCSVKTAFVCVGHANHMIFCSQGLPWL